MAYLFVEEDLLIGTALAETMTEILELFLRPLQ